jgi:hypothetical protein
MIIKTAKIGGFFVPGNRPPENRKFELHGELGSKLGSKNTKKNGLF